MLPDFIVHHILSYLLYDPKSRVRMSVLSKEWFALTASVPILYFRLNFLSREWYSLFPLEYHFEYITETFYKYVEYTVSRFCHHNISAHTLDINAELSNLEEIELFRRCLELLIEKGLKVMVIEFEYLGDLPMFRLPNTFFSASSLTSLTLHQCEFSSSLMDVDVKFKSLRLLSLAELPIDEGVIEYLIKGCPLLEEICLRICYGFETFSVKRHHNLQKVEIYSNTGIERIDIDAPNLSYFLLNHTTDKAPASMSMDSCKNLTTFCYSGFPLKRFNDLLSNFPFIESVSLNLSSPVDNLKLSHHFLRSLELQSDCDMEEIDLDTPNLRLFEYYDRFYGANAPSLYRKHMSKGYMKCVARNSFDIILWYRKLRKFLEKNSIFKVLKLDIDLKNLKDFEELKLIQSPPYELEHVELMNSFNINDVFVHAAAVDAVLWCCRPRSITLELYHFIDRGHVVKYTYEKLLRQENEGHTSIKFVLFSSSKGTQHFSDLNSLLKRLSLEYAKCKRYFDGRKSKITFIKEEVVQEAG